MRCACGARLGLSDKFCRKCGTPAPASAESTAAAEVKEYAKDMAAESKIVAKEAAQLAKAAIKSDVGKSVATCAALGAVICVPVPFVGPVFGATVGGMIGLIRKI